MKLKPFQLTGEPLQVANLPAFTGDATSLVGTSVLTLASVNSNVGSFGSATTSPTFTVNAKGLLTAAGGVTITPAFSSITGRPTTLGGYSITDAQQLNATLTSISGAPWVAGTQVLTLTAANTITLKTVGALAGNLLDKSSGDTLYLGITAQAVDSQKLAGQLPAYYQNASNLNTGTLPIAQLPAHSGDVSSTAGSNILTLATVNTNVGSFGSTTAVPILTVNAKGLVTGVLTAALGTAAVKNTGTSGNTIPLLDGSNVWSSRQDFTNRITRLGGALYAGYSGTGYDHIGYNFLPTGIGDAFNYGVADSASMIYFYNGGFRFYTAPTGTVGSAITPTNVMSISQTGVVSILGTVSASNLNGTNTGDQTITLTGDITGSGTGSFVTTLATVNGTSGSYGATGTNPTVPTITVNSKGLVTSSGSYALGSSSLKNTGTSGNTVPLLDGPNTWSSNQIYSGNQTVAGSVTIGSSTVTNVGLDINRGAPNSGPAAHLYSNSAGGSGVQALNGLTIYNNLSGGLLDTTIVYGASTNSYLAIGHQNGTSYAERMRINSTGNIGIGTASPSELLHLYSANPRLIIEGTVAGSDRQIQFFEAGVFKTGIAYNNGNLYIGGNGVDLTVSKGLNVLGAATFLTSVIISNGDQSTTRLKLNNTASTLNREFHWVAGVNNETQDGFSLFDSRVGTRYVLGNDGTHTFRGPVVSTVAITAGTLVIAANGASAGARLNAGGGGTQTGYVEFYDSSTRQGYIGNFNSTSPMQISGNGLGFQFIGGGPLTHTGTISNNGYLASFGDVYASRSANTGVIYLGSNGLHYVYYDGGAYNMPSGNLVLGGNLGTGGVNPAVNFHAKSNGEIARFEMTSVRNSNLGYLTFYDPTGRSGYIGYAGITKDMYINNDIGDIYFQPNAAYAGRFSGTTLFLPQIQAWNATTPGASVGALHVGSSSPTASTGGAITFGAHDIASGLSAQAGIYVTSDGSYGTRMYFATTDSYATGSKTAIGIDSTGNVRVSRGVLSSDTRIVVGAGSPSGFTSTFAANLADDTAPTTISTWDNRHVTFGSASAALGISYSNTNNMSYIHSLNPGVAWKSLTINSNTLFLNSTLQPAGIGAPILTLNNNSSSGQSSLDYVINGTTRGRFRVDYQGNVNYVAVGGGHNFYVNGDSGTGSSVFGVTSASVSAVVPITSSRGTASGPANGVQSFGFQSLGYYGGGYGLIDNGGSPQINVGLYLESGAFKIGFGSNNSALSPAFAFGSNGNLNLSYLNGYVPDINASGNSIAVRQINGYLFATYFNQQSGANENPTIDQVFVSNSDQSYLRKCGIGNFIVQAMNRSNVFGAGNNGGYYSKFLSNGDTGNTASAPLQAYSNNGSGATMSFLRDGQFGLMMGLDSDNIFRIGGWSASANRLQMDMSGNLTMAGNITAYSDARLKYNVRTINGALDKVLLMRGVLYNLKSDDTQGSGVIAQELEVLAPELVHEDSSGTKSVAYGNTVGYLIEAIKELARKNDDLMARIQELENK